MEKKEKNQTNEDRIKKLRNQARQQSFGYILAAFGLVAGLAWNEAVKSLIDSIFIISQNSVTAKFLYAVLITGLVVVVTHYLNPLANKEN